MGHSLIALVQAKLNEQQLSENQPCSRAVRLLNERLFPAGHPYQQSTIGSMGDLNAASVDDVQQWFRT